MFDQLFIKPKTLREHQNAPYAEERACYLRHCASEGYSRETLLQKARDLLWISRKLVACPNLRVDRQQLESVAQDWKDREKACGRTLNLPWTRKRFIETARPWLRFLGRFQEQEVLIPFEELLNEFVVWMREERDLASTTIQRRTEYVERFLRWYGTTFPHRRLSDLAAGDIDIFLAQGVAGGWGKRSTRNMCASLRSFLRFGAAQEWNDASLPDTICGPRLFSLDVLPQGPAWPSVQGLLAAADTDHPTDIRDRAILLLFAVYGLRASEVGQLRLADLDWEADLLYVARAKNLRRQVFPLVSSVGNAIARYLREVRPSSTRRAVFLSLLPPYRPLSRGALYSITRNRMRALGIESVHYGPHALRHACAARLLAEGVPLKTIGDHLGHRSTSATRIYAKVDLPGLRKVAAFDLGELS